MRTSTTHPLQIAALDLGKGMGRIGVTFCPGKQQPASATGGWARSLDADLRAIRDWGAVAVLTLVETAEMDALGVAQLGQAVGAAHLDWVHAPIPDVSTPGPDFETAWPILGEELRARLRAGFDVVVHCKGGLGRAGMIAARLMVELGVAGADEAMARVRQVRPGAIETRAQEDHVRSCRPVPEAEPLTAADAIEDRAIGALLGLALGDAVGTTLEFKARDTYAPLTDMVGGGPFGLEPGQWTDDTAMALALADSLARSNDDLDEQDLLTRFDDWRRRGSYSCTGTCFDIGVTTSQALQRWRRDGGAHSGSTDPRTAGNGSLMRLAPVTLRFWGDRPRLRDVAARQSRTTHGAGEAVDTCVAYAEILADAIEGQRRSEVLSALRDVASSDISAILGGSWRGKPREAIRASGYVAHSLEASLWSVGASPRFDKAVLRAANLGEDADTTAAITGQLAGALAGHNALPQDWMGKLAWRSRLEEAARALLT